MIGISIYLSKERENFNIEQILKASKLGFNSVFTSLHITEDNPKEYKRLLLTIGEHIKRNKMSLIADLSPKSLGYLGLELENADEIKGFGVTGLRVDYGFTKSEIVNLSQKISVLLNASTISEEYIKDLIRLGLNTENTEAMHNFYPRPETGLSREYFIRKNKLLRKYNIKVSAFIAGDGEKRHPLHLGLPTLEIHRTANPLYAYLDLTCNCFVDSVFVGDVSLKESTISLFTYLVDNVIPIRYQGEELYEFDEFFTYLEGQHRNRLDPAQDVIRIASSRIDLNNSKNLQPINTITRAKGAITIDNIHYGRYSGEIHVTLKNMEKDNKINVIGHVLEKDIPLLNFIDGGSKFLLKKVN